MTDEELKSAPLALRVRPGLKAKLQELADRDRRSLSNYVEIVLEGHVAQAPAGKTKSRK